MNKDIQARLVLLRSNYRAVTSEEFNHFYCPILFKDDDVPLCKGHVINKAFRSSSRAWTVQRRDVDSFFGTHFEDDFTALQEAEKWRESRVFSDKRTYRKLRPKFMSGDREIKHFFLQGDIPQGFTAIEVQDGGKPLVLGLKMGRQELLSVPQEDWQLEISKDVRLAAIVSAIKAAHLTLVCLLGYRYVLSAAGHFVGNDILGKFFLENVGRSRPELLKNAAVHFRQFVHIVRPVQRGGGDLQGTIKDRKLITCWGGSGMPWAMITFVRTGERLHAVLIPVFEHQNAIGAFWDFLKNESDSVVGRTTMFDRKEVWRIEKSDRRLHWPKTGLLYP